MLNLIRSMFQTSVPVAPMPNDMPDHKGFRVSVYIGAMSHVTTFRTLKAAQAAVMRSKRDAAAWDSRVRSNYGPTRRKWTIQNLENGRFCPYIWQTTRQEVFAA